jgi:hypothetical protein
MVLRTGCGSFRAVSAKAAPSSEMQDIVPTRLFPQQVSKGKPATLHVSLENPWSGAEELTGIVVNLSKGPPSRMFSAYGEPDYNAPVDIEKMTALELKTNSDGTLSYPKQNLAIAPHQSLEFDIDVTRLKWAKFISSVLPWGTLFAVVPDGQYSEYLSISGIDEIRPFEVGSNQIAIEVRH